MRFVPVKSIEAQSILMLHRTRHLLVRQRTAQVSALRAHLAEYGIVVAAGRRHVSELIELLRSENDLPSPALRALLLLAEVIETLDGQINLIEAEITTWHRNNEICRRVSSIPGIGVISATALVATVVDAEAFHSGRQFAAWLGLVPRQNSSGGKERLGGISKMGDRYLRTLLVLGATAMIRRLKGSRSALGVWVTGLLARKPVRVVTVALANKLARIVWAIMVRRETYRAADVTA